MTEANRVVWQHSLENPELRGMGTTLTAVALVNEDGRDVLALVNVGDSRSYRFHDGAISQITTDHSLAEEMVRSGELTSHEAAVHPHRHILTRALGVADDVAVDLWRIQPVRGDRLLLCSDGLTNELEPDQISEVLSSVADPQPGRRPAGPGGPHPRRQRQHHRRGRRRGGRGGRQRRPPHRGRGGPGLRKPPPAGGREPGRRRRPVPGVGGRRVPTQPTRAPDGPSDASAGRRAAAD